MKMENQTQAPQEEKKSISALKEKKPKTPDEIIAGNKKYFRFYEKAPLIITILLGVLFFVWSIVDPAVIQEKAGYFGYSVYYGVFHLESAGLVWFLWVLIGSVVCVATYFVLKWVFSYKILHIYYLVQIEENMKKEK